MHVLILREGFYPKRGGGSIEQWNFAQTLVVRGHDVTVFAPKRAGSPSFERVRGVDIYRPYNAAEHLAGGPTSIRGFLGRVAFAGLVCVALVRWLRTTRPDVVFSASHLTHPASRFLHARYDLPVVTYIAYTPTMDPDKRAVTNPSYLFEQLNFRLFLGDQVFCRTPAVKAALARHTDAPVSLVHGILNPDALRAAVQSEDPAEIRARFGVEETENLLVFVGRFISVKRPERALAVLERLAADYKLVMVGDGPLRDALTAQCANAGLTDRVTFTGEVPHDEVLRLMLAADGLLVTSRTEAYPTVVFEALALGGDVFAPPVGVLPTISHPRLHLTEVDGLATTVSATPLAGFHDVDEATLQEYSMDRYADRLLEAFAALIDLPVAPPRRPSAVHRL